MYTQGVSEIISTHTLTWSVTSIRVQSQSKQAISTHTLTWSVTSPDDFDIIIVDDFNSHAHVERDVTYLENNIHTLISTHTLTWSVTCAPILFKSD